MSEQTISVDAKARAELISKQAQLQEQLRKIQGVLGTGSERKPVEKAIKLNKSGGVYLCLPDTKFRSQKTGKETSFTINMNFEQLRSLVDVVENDRETYAQIRDFVMNDENRVQSLLLSQEKIVKAEQAS